MILLVLHRLPVLGAVGDFLIRLEEHTPAALAAHVGLALHEVRAREHLAELTHRPLRTMSTNTIVFTTAT